MASAATASGRATSILYNPHYPSTPLHSGVARGARYVSLLCRRSAACERLSNFKTASQSRLQVIAITPFLHASSESLTVAASLCVSLRDPTPCVTRRDEPEALRRRFRVFRNPNRHCTTESWRRVRDVAAVAVVPRLCRRGLAAWHCRKF